MVSLRNSEVLRGKIQLVRAGLVERSNLFWNHPQLGSMFPELLFTNYSVSRASIHLMETVRAAALAVEEDPVALATARFLERHIPEERHHDQWMLEDMEAIHLPRQAVLKRMPSPNIAAMVGSQYYWACHIHPVSLLGYLAVIETPPDLALLETLASGREIPRAALRSYFRHAEIDKKHAAEIDAAIDGMPLRERQNAVLAISAFQTIHHMHRAFEELIALAGMPSHELKVANSA
jgi:hypothetical protein